MAYYLDFPAPGLPGKGDIPAKYMLIGMAPSTKRPADRRLEPFGSSSYAVIRKLQEKFATEGGLYVTNLVKEPVQPGKKLRVHQMHLWKPYLMEELAIVQPERVIILGDQVAKELLPSFSKLREDHGTMFPLAYPGGTCYAIPTYHFASIFKDPMKKPLISRDFQRAFCLPDPIFGEYRVFQRLVDIPLQEGRDIYIDLEGTGVTVGSRITMFGVGYDKEGPAFIVDNPQADDIVSFGHRLIEFGCRPIFHNGSYDVMMLKVNTQMRWPKMAVGDTMVWAHLSGEKPVSLKHLTVTHTDLPGSRSGGGYEDKQYLAEDVRSTAAIREVWRPRIEDTFISSVFMRLVPIVAEMRIRGVYIDPDQLVDIHKEYGQRQAELLAWFAAHGGGSVNFNAPAQVANFLRSYGIELDVKTKAGADSVAEKVLLDLAKILDGEKKELVEKVLEYRGVNKLMSGFINPFLEVIRETREYPFLMHPDLVEALYLLHPSFLLHGTATGRLSCKKPNLQQIPRVGPLKKAFRSRWKGGFIGLVDLAQAELRIAALISEDEEMVKAVNGPDIHAEMASYAFPDQLGGLTIKEIKEKFPRLRKASKATTFGTLYGGTPGGLSKKNNVPKENIEAVLKVLKSRFKKLFRWLKAQGEYGNEHLEIILPFGQIRSLYPEFVYEGEHGVYRKAVNTPIQGTAAHCMLFILSYIWSECERLNLRSRPIANIHDSTMLDIHPDEVEVVGQVVQNAFKHLWLTPMNKFRMFKELPLTGELIIGESWAKCESTNENYGPVMQIECSSEGGDVLLEQPYLLDLAPVPQG